MTNAIPAPPTDTPYKLDESRVWEIRESHVSLPWDRFEFKRHDTIDDETPFPHDLADFDDEDLANDDDDDVAVATVAKAMVPKNPTGEVGKPADSIPAGKPGTSGYRRLRINEACRRSVLSGTIEAHSCLSGDRQGVPDALPFLAQDRGRAEGGVLGKISTQRALGPNLDDETYNVEGVRSRRPANISQADWDVHLAFLLDPKNAAWCAQNAQNRAKSKAFCRQGSRSLTVLRDMHMESSKTREYPSLIQTYFDTHTVDGVFLRDEERLLYEEMRRLQGLGPNTPTGVPYSDGPLFVLHLYLADLPKDNTLMGRVPGQDVASRAIAAYLEAAYHS
ncbi:hypothetical protein Tco_0352298 [Tanacetum coccineum]